MGKKGFVSLNTNGEQKEVFCNILAVFNTVYFGIGH